MCVGAPAALVNELDGFGYCPEDDVVLGSQEQLAEARQILAGISLSN